MEECPECGSYNSIRYGKNNKGIQKYRCKDCGRQFVENEVEVCEMLSELYDQFPSHAKLIAEVASRTMVSVAVVRYIYEHYCS